MFYEDYTPVVHHVKATSTDGIHFTVQGVLTSNGLDGEKPRPHLGVDGRILSPVIGTPHSTWPARWCQYRRGRRAGAIRLSSSIAFEMFPAERRNTLGDAEDDRYEPDRIRVEFPALSAA